MNEFRIIKNALCVTFDSLNRVGYYTIVIKGNRIFDIEYNSTGSDDEILLRKYPDSVIYNAKGKILLPSFLNANKNSSYILSSIFFRNLKYDELNTNISLRLIDNYFLKNENLEDLLNLFKISFVSSLINGECFINESSRYINSELILNDLFSSIKVKPNIIFTVYDNYLSDYVLGVNRFHCIGIKEDEDLNNYTISSLKSSLSRGNKRALIEVYQSAGSSDTLRSLFGKSFIRVLSENDLLNRKVIFSNPVYLSNEELAIVSEKNSNILILPTDWIRLSRKTNELEKFFTHKNALSILIGSGNLGKSIFSQVKLLYSIIPKISVSAESLLRLITVIPSEFFNISNICGSIEKNKLANFVLFDVSGIRNMINILELNIELISEFILENLSEKDISDVFFHGIPVLENYKSNFIDFEEIYDLHSNLLQKLHEIGRYFDFKEKILMSERVKKLSLGISEEKKEYVPISLDTTDVQNNDLESDFKIVGIYKAGTSKGDADEVFEEESISDIKTSVLELKNLNNGFNFLKYFEDSEVKTITPKPIKDTTTTDEKKVVFKKKIYFDDTEYSKDNQEDSLKSSKTSIFSHFLKSKGKKEGKIKFRKDKLRFGFDDE
ncbi:MAG: amidohydrolase family protein [Ignavibacteria bacterium]|nr:amidohydrolase family protein [Ignavibacteria bacterium]